MNRACPVTVTSARSLGSSASPTRSSFAKSPRSRARLKHSAPTRPMSSVSPGTSLGWFGQRSSFSSSRLGKWARWAVHTHSSRFFAERMVAGVTPLSYDGPRPGSASRKAHSAVGLGIGGRVPARCILARRFLSSGRPGIRMVALRMGHHLVSALRTSRAPRTSTRYRSEVRVRARRAAPRRCACLGAVPRRRR